MWCCRVFSSFDCKYGSRDENCGIPTPRIAVANNLYLSGVCSSGSRVTCSWFIISLKPNISLPVSLRAAANGREKTTYIRVDRALRKLRGVAQLSYVFSRLYNDQPVLGPRFVESPRPLDGVRDSEIPRPLDFPRHTKSEMVFKTPRTYSLNLAKPESAPAHRDVSRMDMS